MCVYACFVYCVETCWNLNTVNKTSVYTYMYTHYIYIYTAHDFHLYILLYIMSIFNIINISYLVKSCSPFTKFCSVLFRAKTSLTREKKCNVNNEILLEIHYIPTYVILYMSKYMLNLILYILNTCSYISYHMYICLL